MVVREGNIHSTVNFITLADVLCTEHMLDAINSIELPNILKFTDFKSWTAIDGCNWSLGDFGAIIIALFLKGG